MLITKDPRGVTLRWLRLARAGALRTLIFATSAEVLCAILAIGGTVALVIGVRLNFGDGWALIAGSVPMLACAFFLIRGLSRV